MDPENVAADEARRIAQLERIKGKLEDAVRARIAEEAASSSTTEQAEVESVAAGLKHKAAAEVLEAEAEMERARRVARVAQVVDYVFFLAYSLIGLQIGLTLFGARSSSGFKQFLDFVTLPLLGPFRGLMPDPSLGPMRLMVSYIVALLVYALTHRALMKLLRLLAHRQARL